MGRDFSNDDDYDEEDEDAEATRRALRAKDPLPRQIIRVNRQVYSECSSTLYSNRIKSSCDPITAKTLLQSLSDEFRSCLGFLACGRKTGGIATRWQYQ